MAPYFSMKALFPLFVLLSLLGCGEDNTSSVPLSPPFTEAIKKLPINPVECEYPQADINFQALLSKRCNWLSDFNLFVNFNPNDIIANGQGIGYELNSTLFTDFSDKYRFMFVPEQQSLQFQEITDFDFPTGSTLVKIFSLSTNNENKIVEVRLSIKRENGWVYLPYIWVESLQDAFFYREGFKIDSLVESNRQRIQFSYEIPSSSNCLECHKGEIKSDEVSFHPIGLKARHLNKVIMHQGEQVNQLALWESLGLINGLPEDLTKIDTMPDWRDESANLQDRAKAYLDINCAHCHSEGGSAALSGLRLEYWRKSISHAHGVCNSSHGWRGGGFDIWPGRGDISSIPIRMRHTEAKDRMPPIGRNLVDEDAATLVSAWIDSLPLQECAQ